MKHVCSQNVAEIDVRTSHNWIPDSYKKIIVIAANPVCGVALLWSNKIPSKPDLGGSHFFQRFEEGKLV